MIDQAYVQTMARYNRWQNDSLYSAADTLTDQERRRDRGVFFKSIHGTLNHLLWADSMWMSRFSDVAAPPGTVADSAAGVTDWDALKRRRVDLDQTIIDWAARLDPSALTGDLAFQSRARDIEIVNPRWLAIVHMVNHQTHHRGQIHAMLTAAGATPLDTDLILMKSEPTP